MPLSRSNPCVDLELTVFFTSKSYSSCILLFLYIVVILTISLSFRIHHYCHLINYYRFIQSLLASIDPVAKSLYNIRAYTNFYN